MNWGYDKYWVLRSRERCAGFHTYISKQPPTFKRYEEGYEWGIKLFLGPVLSGAMAFQSRTEAEMFLEMNAYYIGESFDVVLIGKIGEEK